ncbi:hypothetical protein P8452_57082 [Trifolium repens]|nr:hypothetical protein P8452_57082 [Trifolium repens]
MPLPLTALKRTSESTCTVFHCLLFCIATISNPSTTATARSPSRLRHRQLTLSTAIGRFDIHPSCLLRRFHCFFPQ